MESLSENRPLLWSIALSALAIVGLLTGSSPEFNEQFALVDIPTEVSSTDSHTPFCYLLLIIIKETLHLSNSSPHSLPCSSK